MPRVLRSCSHKDLTDCVTTLSKFRHTCRYAGTLDNYQKLLQQLPGNNYMQAADESLFLDRCVAGSPTPQCATLVFSDATMIGKSLELLVAMYKLIFASWPDIDQRIVGLMKRLGVMVQLDISGIEMAEDAEGTQPCCCASTKRP